MATWPPAPCEGSYLLVDTSSIRACRTYSEHLWTSSGVSTAWRERIVVSASVGSRSRSRQRSPGKPRTQLASHHSHDPISLISKRLCRQDGQYVQKELEHYEVCLQARQKCRPMIITESHSRLQFQLVQFGIQQHPLTLIFQEHPQNIYIHSQCLSILNGPAASRVAVSESLWSVLPARSLKKGNTTRPTSCTYTCMR